MSSNALVVSDSYALATGAPAVRRLEILHQIYSPAGKRVLQQAGLTKQMTVADFGCGVGVVTRMLAEMVGSSGSVTGIDVNAAQLEQAAELCAAAGLTNTRFVEASADRTGLPRDSFDLVYCRFLLLHLPDPAACLREMCAVLKPGGILVVEDGDLASAGSVPPTALNAFAYLFGKLGPVRGLDYSMSKGLYQLIAETGFSDLRIEIHQPADSGGVNGLLLKWSVQEAGNAFIDAGILTANELEQTVIEMQNAIEDPGVLVLAPQMSIVSARKPTTIMRQ